MKFLLDTCVISELANRRPNASVISWLGRQDPESLYLSFITVGELAKGIAKRGGDARAMALEKWLKGEILDAFADRILPVEKAVALEWGRICGEAERAGRKRPAVDALIAATALVHDMKLVTRNVDDMAGMGVPIFNPFA
ncbi:MAG: type II toxin-antitoxin system VapC family toxin [Kiritimatiellae bacterium]|nr:type II toxin-antitoxin system VapC family toxin [Kiritimatiellia bacterium]